MYAAIAQVFVFVRLLFTKVTGLLCLVLSAQKKLKTRLNQELNLVVHHKRQRAAVAMQSKPAVITKLRGEIKQSTSHLFILTYFFL